MNKPVVTTAKRRETGFRLLEDQICALDLMVSLSRGRRKRSHLVSEAIDEYLASRNGRLRQAA